MRETKLRTKFGQIFKMGRLQTEPQIICWLMCRVICILALVALSVLLVACQRRAEFVAPKEADSAIVVATTYLKTNGIIEQPVLQAAEFRDGVWRLELVSAKSRKSDLDCWIVRVSSEDQILSSYGPH
jgi:hypothetical protein